MASPVKPSDFQALIIGVSSTLCAGFLRLLLQMPVKIYELVNWMLDSEGNLTNEFRAQAWPAGSVILSATASSPPGSWLECDGASYEREDYDELFTAIGTLYGAADGTHFNVPDLRGRAPIGKGTLIEADGTTSGATYTQGTKIGGETATLAMANLPASPPPLGDKVDSMVIFRNTAVAGDNTVLLGSISAHSVRGRDNAHGVDADEDNALANLGDGTGHENRGPSLVMRYWISVGVPNA